MTDFLKINGIKTVLGGGITYLLGSIDSALLMLVAFVAMDFVFGIAHAVSEKRLSTNKLLAGAVKKLGFFAMIAMAHLLGGLMGIPLRELVVFFLIGNEGLSILSHLEHFEVPMPPQLKTALEKMREKEHAAVDSEN